MSALRALSTVYLIGALGFSAAIVLDRNPALDRATRSTVAMALEGAQTYIVTPAADLVKTTRAKIAVLLGAEEPTAKPRPAHPDLARVKPRPAPVPEPRRPELAAPPAQQIAPPDVTIADDAAPKPVPPQAVAAARPPALDIVPVPPPSSADVSPAELTRVTLRLKENLTREMYENFALFLYVSKADSGPWAQHMFVFRKDGAGDLSMLYAWPASTGRELDEMAPNGTHQPSFTPRGYYEIDPARMYKIHYSGQWRQPMPHAMFFNWEHDGLQTGLAIHGAVGLEVAQLGSRASAGCVRIAPDKAALLFNLIRSQYKGLAPRFAYDRRTASMSNDGLLMHDADGKLKMADGYKVLVFIENYGGENVVAALY